ncbi:MAG: Stk1 family PASTA domain-containing Ser/Thr kinase, partial [Actinobacteria bacterium]|nr:Stk1 family PASTA domain-containing Ser/Thr kinase [Actinomycetota bacterium]
PNIVGVYDWGAESGTYYIVMEYVEGQSLAEVIRDNGPLQPRRAAEITFEVAGALAAAHTRGVVHRDVKPGNVLLSTTGTAKVTDFGIARALSSPSDDLTQAGSVMGTATYFSPEQAQGFAVDERSDLYSLGVVLYEMLCGRPPFVGETPVAIAYKHVQEWPPRPSQFVTGVPAGLEAVILKLLAKKPEQRYRSGDDLRADLRRFLDGQVTVAEQEFANPTPTGSAPAVVASDATAVNQVVAVEPNPTTALPAAALAPEPIVEDTWYEEPEEAEKRNGAFVAVASVLAVALIALAVFLIWSSRDGDVAQVAIPPVAGKVEAEARDILEAEGFNPRTERVPSNDVAENIVIGTNPPEGQLADKGSDVTILISAGQETIELPNLATKTLAQAQAELTALELTSTVEEVDSELEAGTVVSTDPVAGTPVAKGSAVKLVVSKGLTEIPTVAGLNGDEARKKLNEAGFTNLMSSMEASDTVAAGKVIRTDPSGPAQKTTPITIVVSSGAAEVTLPDVIGSREADAQAELKALNLKVSTKTTALPPGDSNNGRVVSMTPDVGEKVAPGATVTITVGVAGAATTTTPSSTTTTTPPTTTTTAP